MSINNKKPDYIKTDYEGINRLINRNIFTKEMAKYNIYENIAASPDKQRQLPS